MNVAMPAPVLPYGATGLNLYQNQSPVVSPTGGYGTQNQIGANLQQQALATGQQLTQQNQQLTALMNTVQQVAQQPGGYTVQAARADAQGLITAANNQLTQNVMPTINSAAEGAGASGSALTALLAQNAIADIAGQTAQQGLGYIRTAVQDQSNRHSASLQALTGLSSVASNRIQATQQFQTEYARMVNDAYLQQQRFNMDWQLNQQQLQFARQKQQADMQLSQMQIQAQRELLQAQVSAAKSKAQARSASRGSQQSALTDPYARYSF